MGLRGSTRMRYNIEGGSLSDCCIALFCAPCELVQQSRELDLEEGSLTGR
jgi:Cys-rich protein (TIGR01571 family)